MLGLKKLYAGRKKYFLAEDDSFWIYKTQYSQKSYKGFLETKSTEKQQVKLILKFLAIESYSVD